MNCVFCFHDISNAGLVNNGIRKSFADDLNVFKSYALFDSIATIDEELDQTKHSVHA